MMIYERLSFPSSRRVGTRAATTILAVCFAFAAGCARRAPARPLHLVEAAQSAPTALPALPASQNHDPSLTEAADLDLGGTHLMHPTPYIPSQCYTATRDDGGAAHNPCYTCHQTGVAPNYIHDGNLQREVSLPEPARTNPFTNLFEDRTHQVASVPEADVVRYVRQDNYGVGSMGDRLARLLSDVPSGWDIDDDGRWGGYSPDANFVFDENGFDRAPDGSPTGWRAFAYYPFLGTFFPTNGSTDDVLIRLPLEFRQDLAGTYDEGTYVLNLAIVEAAVRRMDVSIEATDERTFGVDLDRNGRLGTASRVAFAWDPPRGVEMRLVGRAGASQRAGATHLLAGLFPVGTEFLHSVRYLDVGVGDSGVGVATRMKELRYARKRRLYGYGELEQLALREAREDHDQPDRAREIMGNAELGVSNGQGWVYQGFIEDRAGALRPQTFEEHATCLGCHGGIGATTDGIFAFPRKLDFRSPQHGWSHPTQHGLAGVADPTRGDGTREYATYLRVNGAGDEFRSNDEVRARFFLEDGRENPSAFRALATDITTLLMPSPERAIRLDAAYMAIVRAQSFVRGRDATVTPVVTVHRTVDEGTLTGIEIEVEGPGSLRSR